MTICNLTSYRFNNGDALAIPFLCRSTDGTIADITGLTVTAELWARGTLLDTLTTPEGVEIVDPFPPEEEDQTPHGIIHLSDEDASALPFGSIAYFKIKMVDGDGVPVSTMPIHLNKVLP